MADRFPLIVDSANNNIKELPSGDTLDLTGSSLKIGGTVTVGVDDTGYDVKFFGDTASAYMLWDTSADDLILGGAAGLDVDGVTNLDNVDIDGTVQIDGATTFGVDDTGVDVKLFGATSGAYLLWDESADKLLTAGGATIDVVKDKLLIGGTAVTTTAAELNLLDNVSGLVQADFTKLAAVNSTAAELNLLSGAGTLKQAGKETIWVPATAMYPNSTNGCSTLTQVALGTNMPDIKVLDFIGTGSQDEYAQFTVAFPKSWNEGTVTFQPFWMVTGTDTGTVAWGLQGVSCENSDPAGDEFGTATVTTALAFSGTSNDVMVSQESNTVAIEQVADDAVTFFQIFRDVSADTQTGDARLLGIKLFFTTDAANDA